jgi:hypothetical protein
MIMIGKKIKILPQINADGRGSGKEQKLTRDKHGQDGSARIGNMEIGRKPPFSQKLMATAKSQEPRANYQEPQSS